MQKHEFRNEQPPLKEREIELLIYGVFSGFDGDKGYYYTAWVPLGDVLMSISPETVIAKLARFRDGLARALDVACAVIKSGIKASRLKTLSVSIEPSSHIDRAVDPAIEPSSQDEFAACWTPSLWGISYVMGVLESS